MSDLSENLTRKQEAFALAYFETGNAAEAYRRAYDKPEGARDNWLYVEASQLLDHPKISLRLEELRQRAEDLAIFSRNQALRELEDARQLAHKEGQAGAAVSAVKGKMRLFALDKQQHEVKGAEPDGSIGVTFKTLYADN